MPSGMDKQEHLDVNSLLKKSKSDLIKIILAQQDIQIPASVLSSKLHPLQALVKYLKDEKSLSIRAIALLLKRDVQTVYTSYRLAGKNKMTFGKSDLNIPISVFSKDGCSILESAVHYLKTYCGLSLTDISLMLNKSIKTIWTCNNRFMIKEGKK